MDLQHLRASDGTGEAVLAHIQSVRNPGSTVLDLDNVDNWNSKVIIVTGTPAANGYIAAAGMKVMYGHISAGDLVIDGFAPGYTDNGNTTQEVALVKMCTAWADALVDILGIAHQDNGKLKTTALDDFFKPSELIDNFVASGGIVAQSVSLTGTLSDIVYYINGLRYTKTAIPNKVYSTSKDTYVDIDTTGTITYNEVANNAAAPALAASNIRLAKVVTNGSTITRVVRKMPDSAGLNGVWIYPDNPQMELNSTGWVACRLQSPYTTGNLTAKITGDRLYFKGYGQRSSGSVGTELFSLLPLDFPSIPYSETAVSNGYRLAISGDTINIRNITAYASPTVYSDGASVPAS